ncbi:MAG: hypothetical protein U0X92_12850 [Anaerolineales bacterium]
MSGNVARKAEREHEDRRDEETEEHHGAASEAVGEFAADELREE